MNIFARIRNAFLPEKGPPAPDDIVLLAESRSEPELQLWADILRRNAVDVMVVAPPSTLVYGGFFGAGRIEVRQKDVEKARELLGLDGAAE